MSEDDKPAQTVHERLTELGDAFWRLTTDSNFRTDGFVQIAVGLNTLSEDLQDLPVAQVESIIKAFQQLLATLNPEDNTPKPQTKLTGLDQFVEGFRLEAKQRLSGLSISMMGIFNNADSEASIRESSQHLHAITGGAAMLGLKPISLLAGAMEDLILALRKKPEDAEWPVKPLLRSFAVLKSAIEDDEFVDILSEELVEELHAQQNTLQQKKTLRVAPQARSSDFSERPLTIPNTRQLEQRILVVDDMDTIAASVGFILSELDVPIDIANSAEDAFDLLHEHAFSLVISDINMPDMSGVELLETMRNDPAFTDISVILLTQNDTPEAKAEALAKGADDFIVKGSIGGGELLDRVTNLLKKSPYVPATSEVTEDLRRILIVEDTETIAASIAFVLSEGPYEIVLAHDGQDALHKLRKRSFSLILSDVEMPSMNGFELLETVKQDLDLQRIPFVMLTSRDDEEDHARAIRLGASGYLIKGDVGSDKLQRVVFSLAGG